MMIRLWALTFALLSSLSAQAKDQRTLTRSPRGLLMGDAYTALADDAYTLFYNPALLARHNFFSFYAVNPSITVNNVLADGNKFEENDSDELGDIAQTYMNYPIHIGLNMAPGFKMGRFGLSAIYNYQTNLILQNAITPTLDIDHRFDKGFIMGYAHPLYGKYNKKSGGEHLAFGISFKYLDREGINASYHLTSTSLMNAMSSGELEEILSSLGQVRGKGWGIDIGFDHVTTLGPAQTLMTSLAILDPYTKMETADNINDFDVQDQPMQINLGTAYNINLGLLLNLTFSLDYRNIHQLKKGDEYSEDLKLGVEVALPLIQFMAGYSGGKYSYGIKGDIGFFDVYLGFFGVEEGEQLGQVTSNRMLLYFSLLEFEFEP